MSQLPTCVKVKSPGLMSLSGSRKRGQTSAAKAAEQRWGNGTAEAVPLSKTVLAIVFLFFRFLIFFVIFVDGVPGEEEFGFFFDELGFGEVEAFGGGFDGADGVGGLGVEAGGVVAGELEAVEEGGGSFGLEAACSEGVDDAGEGELDRFAVFEGGELDVLAGDEVAAGGFGVAVGFVAVVKMVVEVAPEAAGEGGGLAAGSVGLDVTAEFVWHGFSRFPRKGVYPPPYCLRIS